MTDWEKRIDRLATSVEEGVYALEGNRPRMEQLLAAIEEYPLETFPPNDRWRIEQAKAQITKHLATGEPIDF